MIAEDDELGGAERAVDDGLALVAFESSGSLFGAAAGDVLAIDEVGMVTALPMSPPHVLGLLSFRGRPIPLVSIERFSGTAERAPRDGESGQRMLVVTSLGMTVAIRCDRVRGVVVAPKQTAEVSVVIGRGLEGFVTGQTDVGAEMMMILDVAKFLEVSRLRA